MYLAFLDYRNTPIESMHTSPAQRMFARRTRTLLPMLPVLLQTEPAAQREDPGQLKIRKEKQARLYNRTSKKLGTLHPDVVRFKKPTATNDTRKWTQARLEHLLELDHEYTIESDGATYRQNRRQLRSTPEHYNDAGWDPLQQEPDNTRVRQRDCTTENPGRDVFSTQCTSCRRISTTASGRTASGQAVPSQRTTESWRVSAGCDCCTIWMLGETTINIQIL